MANCSFKNSTFELNVPDVYSHGEFELMAKEGADDSYLEFLTELQKPNRQFTVRGAVKSLEGVISGHFVEDRKPQENSYCTVTYLSPVIIPQYVMVPIIYFIQSPVEVVPTKCQCGNSRTLIAMANCSIKNSTFELNVSDIYSRSGLELLANEGADYSYLEFLSELQKPSRQFTVRGSVKSLEGVISGHFVKDRKPQENIYCTVKYWSPVIIPQYVMVPEIYFVQPLVEVLPAKCQCGNC
ncbi:hypothetical protein FQR65_LT04565 [Abscondita terminalis]|nr:hypothetical protein FQR65_LT04565 [Abscondita terminalis]